MSGIKKLLIVSVVVNVIAIGIIGGHAVTNHFRPSPPPHKMMHAIIGSLPDAKQKAARAEYKRAMRENRDNFAQEAKARKRYFNILRAEQFDEAAFDEAGGQLHALRGAMVSRMQDATKSIVKDLNREERVALANALERMMENRDRYHKSGKRPPHKHDNRRGQPPEQRN